jgi:hypothetical protein
MQFFGGNLNHFSIFNLMFAIYTEVQPILQTATLSPPFLFRRSIPGLGYNGEARFHRRGILEIPCFSPIRNRE